MELGPRGRFAPKAPAAPGKFCSEGKEAGPGGAGGVAPGADALFLTWDTANAAKPEIPKNL